MARRLSDNPVCRTVALLHDQVQLLILLLGRFGIMGTVFALGLMLAHHLGRHLLRA